MSNNGGPWGGSSGGRDGEGRGPRGQGGGRRPDGRGGGGRSGGGQIPEIDDLMNKGRERLRSLMGGRGGDRGTGGGGPGGDNPLFSRPAAVIAVGVAVLLWLLASFYSVRPEERSVELFLGRFSEIGTPGLNFAAWPLATHEVVTVTRERTETIGQGAGGDQGLILTGDENIVDIDFSVVWNVRDPAKFLFNLRDPEATVRAVASSAMREIIAQSELAPILNRDRGPIAQRLKELTQSTLDSYDSGVNIIRVNFDKADPPEEVIDAFRKVQAAEQERTRLQNLADAYANRQTAEARGKAAEILQQAEAYRARQINEAQGQASRFKSVLAEYNNAPKVTRKRLYLETMESVLGNVDKVILDDKVNGAGGGGVVPYLPLDQLGRGTGARKAGSSGSGGSGSASGSSATGGGTTSGAASTQSGGT